MKITKTFEITTPSGFYCKKNGANHCYKLNENEGNFPYCEMFSPYLDSDSSGNILKCKECLLAEREARINL